MQVPREDMPGGAFSWWPAELRPFKAKTRSEEVLRTREIRSAVKARHHLTEFLRGVSRLPQAGAWGLDMSLGFNCVVA